MKVGASVVCGGAAGCSATFDELNKYFTISGMPIASSQYWNSVHGRVGRGGDGRRGLAETMRTLARNMTFLMKSIALGRETFGLPEQEERVATHFIGEKATVKRSLFCLIYRFRYARHFLPRELFLVHR